MDGPVVGAAVFVCLFSSALAGVIVHARLPAYSLRLSTRVVMHRGVAVIAVLAAIALVLLTVSQKASFDRANREVRVFSAELIQLDTTLRRAGPPADEARNQLFRYTMHAMQQVWPAGRVMPADHITGEANPLDPLERAIAAIPQNTASGREFVADAERILARASQTDRALSGSDHRAVSPWLVAALLFWLMLTFASFGLSAPPAAADGSQTLVITMLLLGAIALGGASFLFQEYRDPFHGIITVSHEPLQAALFAMSE